MWFESNSQAENTTHRYLNRLIDSIPFLLGSTSPGGLTASVGNTVSCFPVSLGQRTMAACDYSQASHTSPISKRFKVIS